MFVYVNNKGEFRISSHRLDTRKVDCDWKFVRKMNIRRITLSGNNHRMNFSESEGTFEIDSRWPC